MKQATMTIRTTIAMALALVLCASCLGIASPIMIDNAYADEELAAAELDTQTTTVPKTLANPSKKLKNSFKKSTANFSIDLLQRCVASEDANANVTISPTSIMNALVVTANGAKGETSKQMRDVLGGGMSMSDLNKALSWYNKKLSNTKKARLNIANSIWYNDIDKLTMKQNFLNTARDYYDAEVTPADFSNPQTVTDINNWVSDHTNGMIKEIIDHLDPSQMVTIVNALYFDAKWASPFVKDYNTKEKFTDAAGNKKTVTMMHDDEYKYIEGAGATGFVKPYAKGYSYVALLPDEGTSTQDFVASLSGDSFSNLVSGASFAHVKIAMPKHTIEYTNDNLKDQLVAMGMEEAFDPNANFQKMGTFQDGGLYIDSVIHKTKVKVNESGTKAAAVTAVEMAGTTSVEQPIMYKYVTLDRPFVYAIVDNTTNLPVFIGTVNSVK